MEAMQTFASIVVPPVSTRCGLQYGLRWSKAGNCSKCFDSRNAEDLGPRRAARACRQGPRHPGTQAYLGHRNIQHTVRYTELSPTRFKNFWRE